MRRRSRWLLALLAVASALAVAFWPREPLPIDVVAPAASTGNSDDREVATAPFEATQDAESGGLAAESERRAPTRARAIDARRAAHRVRARAVDPDQRALAGARLVLVVAGTRSAWTSDDDGLVDAALEFAPEVDSLEWTLSAPARATRRGTLAPSARTITDLGELVLVAGGALGGRVVDRRGQPLAGARIVIEPPNENAAADAARRGPSPANALFQRLGVDRFERSTDVHGEFEVDGLEATPWAVWAHAEGHEWCVESPVVLHARAERLELVLVLDDADPRRMIRGRLFAPSGEPVAGASGFAIDDVAVERTREDCTTDADGRFVVWVADDAPRRISFASPSWEWDTLEAHGVRAGGDELELVFVESQWIWCDVRDESGAKLTSGRVRVRDAATRDEDWRAMSDIDSEGRARLRRVENPFVVYVEAQGFERSEQGPFAPDALVEPLRVVAVARRGRTGRVSYAGRPVDAATVHVLEALADARAEPRNWRGAGVPFDVDARELVEARTQSARDGRFEVHLPSSNDGPFWLFVEHASFGAAYAGPIVPANAHGELNVELQPYARVHGVLSLRSGRTPAGWRVHASDAHGRERACAVADDGSFDLPQLGSGEWQVRAVRAGVTLHDHGVRLFPGRTRKADVVLASGSVVRFDFVADDARRELVGRLTVDGGEPGPWSARLGAAGALGDARLQSTGEFRFELTTEVETDLMLFASAGAWSGWWLRERVALAEARTDWQLDLAVAHVSGTLLTPLGADVGVLLELEPRVGSRLERALVVESDGTIPKVIAPAGRAALVARRLGGRKAASAPEAPRVLARFELAPGADEHVDIE